MASRLHACQQRGKAAPSRESAPAAQLAAAPPPPHPGPAGSRPQCAPAAPASVVGTDERARCKMYGLVHHWTVQVPGWGAVAVVTWLEAQGADKARRPSHRFRSFNAPQHAQPTWFSSVHSVSRSLRSHVSAHGASGLPVALNAGGEAGRCEALLETSHYTRHHNLLRKINAACSSSSLAALPQVAGCATGTAAAAAAAAAAGGSNRTVAACIEIWARSTDIKGMSQPPGSWGQAGVWRWGPRAAGER